MSMHLESLSTMPIDTDKVKDILASLPSPPPLALAEQAVALLHQPLIAGEERHYSDEMYFAGVSLLSWANTRLPGQYKVRIVPLPQNERHAQVEFIGEDVPFLVDSMSAYLAEQGVTIETLHYPVINVERDDTHHVLTLHPVDNGMSLTAESWISIKIHHLRAPEHLQELETGLQSILAQVYLAVANWQPMLQALHHIRAQYRTHEHEEWRAVREELGDFLDWLEQGNFIFLGYNTTLMDGVASTELGLLAQKDDALSQALAQDAPITTDNCEATVRMNALIHIEKVAFISPVHRREHLTVITLKHYDPDGRFRAATRFIGMFTTKLHYQSAGDIPIIRFKLAQLLEESGVMHHMHNRKEFTSLLDEFPRSVLLHYEESALFEVMATMMRLLERPQVKLFILANAPQRFLTAIICIPRPSLSTTLTTSILDILASNYHAKIDSHQVRANDPRLATLFVTLACPALATNEMPAIEWVEQQIVSLSRRWQEELLLALSAHYGEEEGHALWSRYHEAFPHSYQEQFQAEIAAEEDIPSLEAATAQGKVVFRLHRTLAQLPGAASEALILKITSPGKAIPLSEVMPILDNLGFQTLTSHTSVIDLHTERYWLHSFELSLSGALSDFEQDHLRLEEALHLIWEGQIPNDRLNGMLCKKQLGWRHVFLMRAYTHYLRQIGFVFATSYVTDVCLKHADIVVELLQLFLLKFDPSTPPEARTQNVDAQVTLIQDRLQAIQIQAEDKILKRCMELIIATLRTNYFQHDTAGNHKPYLSLKFRSSLIPEMPMPRPFSEIYVFAMAMEGVHLRGGKVARGGIRWSDRTEDYRTEILGLMKAQTAKNAIIVPVGAKGGFVIKGQDAASMSREAWLQEGVRCYRMLLSGMLDITDNIVQGQTISPPETVCYDEEDPYLVVAADKGTASFSDYANAMAKDYEFWLGDAFASGGSAGYDHKKMGITARGAWVAIHRHCYEIGHRLEDKPLTVIGIGDMAGDVFGNGLLLSDRLKLVGAFNHAHIFIDPDPDPALSFSERKRLFELPRSNWTDYNHNLLSPGGAIYERSAKTITLSPEAKVRFGLERSAFTPDELIQLLLCAEVDLLYNGGIGTYVKSTEEVNSTVGDKTNDALRVNGADLRCKIVAEGGNLGFTQRGRIEYAQKGGRINTDAIDNSAGVDCSDHEVNIKIALRHAITTGQLEEDAREVLLRQMTDRVSSLVLRDNTLQNLAISLEARRNHHLLALHERLIKFLAAEGILDPALERLPSAAEIERRQNNNEGLVRPELAVLLAYSKLYINHQLIESTLPDDPYYMRDLLRYFPENMRDSYKEAILAHPLKREVIATFISNSMVNRVGTIFCQLAMSDTDLRECDVARAYTIARDAFNLRQVWDDIEALGSIVPGEVQLQLFQDVRRVIHKITFWCLRNLPQPMDVGDIVERFQTNVKTLYLHKNEALTGNARANYDTRLQHYRDLGIPYPLDENMACLMAFSSACDVIHISNQTGWPVVKVSQLHYALETRYQLFWLRAEINKLANDTYWQRLSLHALKDEIYDLHMQLTLSIIRMAMPSEDPMESWSLQYQKNIQRYDAFINDLHALSVIEMPALIVAAKRVRALLPKK
jgi:glutamate dehydrogenase